jgi:hypothetical protein
MKNQLTDQERQILLRLIDMQMRLICGRMGGSEYIDLAAIRRKLEGVDKRVVIE